MKWDIGIDVRMIQHTGIGTYVRQILPGVLQSAKDQSLQVALYESPERPCTQAAPAHRPFRAPIYSLNEQWEYSKNVSECRLWHSPHYNIPFFKGKTKLVVTIHDIIHWVFRKSFLSKTQEFYAGLMLARAVKYSDHILTVSEHTQSDLIRYFQADPRKITVTYEGVDERFSVLVDNDQKINLKEKYRLPDSFFLYVGSFKLHKNLPWLLRTFTDLRDQKKTEAALVLVGKDDLKDPELTQLLNSLKSRGLLHHIERVEYSELPIFYQMAKALIHPSLYEGFGLTLLEAMASQTPVIACRNSSIPEVAGEGAYLIESSNSVQLQNALMEIEGSETIRQQLIEKGKENVRRFHWNKTAEQTFAVYEKVLRRS
ncbi:MAG: glycosyltransferase family 1 protein [Candidatus Omnitrophica bacterium]|nr:glycosyltransferase family 1 protein [Candidatus Omnitrophota bacterium]